MHSKPGEMKKRKIKTKNERSPKKKKKKQKFTTDVQKIGAWIQFRLLQRETGCSNSSLNKIADSFAIPMRIRRQADVLILKKSGAKVLELNGCIGCHKFVWTPCNKSTRCPKCNGRRYHPDSKTPLERAFYFPIGAQLRKLLKLKSFRDLLLHEYKRTCNSKFMSDVFDSPLWQQIAGLPSSVLTRILLHYCVDAIPAFAIKHSISLKPCCFLILSLPPSLRYKATNMLLQMLIPSKLKGDFRPHLFFRSHLFFRCHLFFIFSPRLFFRPRLENIVKLRTGKIKITDFHF